MDIDSLKTTLESINQIILKHRMRRLLSFKNKWWSLWCPHHTLNSYTCKHKRKAVTPCQWNYSDMSEVEPIRIILIIKSITHSVVKDLLTNLSQNYLTHLTNVVHDDKIKSLPSHALLIYCSIFTVPPFFNSNYFFHLFEDYCPHNLI